MAVPEIMAFNYVTLLQFIVTHTCSCSAHCHSRICFDANIEAKLFIEYKCQYCMWCKTNESKYVPLKKKKRVFCFEQLVVLENIEHKSKVPP